MRLQKQIDIGIRNSIKRYGRLYTKNAGIKLINTLVSVPGSNGNDRFLTNYRIVFNRYFPNTSI